MQIPLVSVVIPTYNHARYVYLAVESVLKQSYPNIQILVIDDGSTDGTAQVLRPYMSRIQYFYKPNGGTPNALNYGLARASGKYICWLSADDVFMEDKVAKQVTLMEGDPELGFCYTSFVVIDALGHTQTQVNSPFYANRQELITKLIEGCFINGSSVMMRSSALATIGWFDEGLPQAHDYDLWFRLLRKYPCGFLGDFLLAYRWHGENMSQNQDDASIQIVKERAMRMFPEWIRDVDCAKNSLDIQ